MVVAAAARRDNTMGRMAWGLNFILMIGIGIGRWCEDGV